MNLLTLRQGARYAFSSLQRRLFGGRRFRGSAKQICLQVIEACYNGEYFRNSLGNYAEFWTRDFGISCRSLLALGYRREVISTLRYALGHFSSDTITTAITPRGASFSFPATYSPDSVALLFNALAETKVPSLVSRHRNFLEAEAKKFAQMVLDGKDRIRTAHFSGMRDYVIRSESCYDASMVYVMQHACKKLNISFPRFDAKQCVMRYWNGRYFNASIKDTTLTADANLFALQLPLSRHIRQSVVQCMEKNLTGALPLPYTASDSEPMQWMEFLVPNWERRMIWTHIGFLYLSVLHKELPERAKKYAKTYARLVEDQGTVFELYTPKHQPYRSLLYYADEGMLWCANLAALL